MCVCVLDMCVCVCVFVSVCVFVCICVKFYPGFTHIRTHIHRRARTHTRTYVSMNARVGVCLSWLTNTTGGDRVVVHFIDYTF